MKYLLDTNIYVDAFRSQEKRILFRRTYLPLLPHTYLSAVVAYELDVNATDTSTSTLLRDFIHPLERMGRVVTPRFSDWLEASRIVTSIIEKDGSWRSKIPGLLNDILIALCARQIGATLITFNREDFRLVRRHQDFSLRVLDAN